MHNAVPEPSESFPVRPSRRIAFSRFPPFSTKTRHWIVIVKPSAFRLLAGEQSLSDYQFGTFVAHHLFCRHCGVRSFQRGHVEQLGGDYVAIQLASLDDADPKELIDAPIRYGDGRNNDWDKVPEEIRHL